MAKAPSPGDMVSANGPLFVASRTVPLEPTQIAREFTTPGNSAAARPPVMGSLALARATRFETTTRFTGPFPDHSPLYKQLFINMVPDHLPVAFGAKSGGKPWNPLDRKWSNACYARTPPRFAA